MLARLHRFAHQLKAHKIAFGKITFGKIALGLLLCGLALTLYLNADTKGKQPDPDTEYQSTKTIGNFIIHLVPKSAPALQFNLRDGRAAGLADFRGRVLVINFWATWCAPCRREMPTLDALQAHFADRDVMVLAISVDRGSPRRAIEFLDRLGITHLTMAYDSEYKSRRAAGLIGLPTTLLLNRQHRELGRLSGEASWNSPAIHQLIEAALKDEQEMKRNKE